MFDIFLYCTTFKSYKLTRGLNSLSFLEIPPSCSKVIGCWGGYRILVSAPVPLGLIGSFEIIGTWLGLGLGGLGTGLDNINPCPCASETLKDLLINERIYWMEEWKNLFKRQTYQRRPIQSVLAAVHAVSRCIWHLAETHLIPSTLPLSVVN